MYKYLTAKNTLTYINLLPQLVSSCNNTYHRSIKMKPSQVTNETKVWDTLYGNDVEKRVRFKFQVGDRVKVSKVRRMFDNLTYLISRKKCLLYTNEWRVKYPFTN